MTNALYLTDRNGLPLAMSEPVASNHHGLFLIDKVLDELFLTLNGARIRTDGLLINADAGFDSLEFRATCGKWVVIR